MSAETTPCQGTPDNHCCWVDGTLCPFFEVGTVEGRSIACGLRREHGNWNAVYQDPRWIATVKPMMDRLWPGLGCADLPRHGETCATCGACH